MTSSAGILARLLPPLRPEWRRIVGSYLIATTSLCALAAIGVLTALGVGGAVVHAEWPPVGWWLALGALVLLRTFLTWREMDVSHALAYRVLAGCGWRCSTPTRAASPGADASTPGVRHPWR